MIEIGSKLNGRYEIIGNIGSGGMAHVFLARDLILNREVAVKVLRFDFQNDQTAIRRFQREALAATELVHPNIVSVYDVGEDNNLQYLVMEFVRGMDLKRYIQTHFPIPFGKVVDIMDQILSAVALAHEHRIIHRDLKPQNVLIDEDGVVKITDFGIAIALSETSLTQTNTMLGSVHYLSPEQARGSMATKQSDIYAMGIILYEMLTGQVPFDGESAVTIALKHFQDDLPEIRDFNSNTPQSLENVVLHATTKDPINRYQTAEEMQEDLQTALNPERLNEPRWIPAPVSQETIAMEPPLSQTFTQPQPVFPEDNDTEAESVKETPKKPKKNNKRKAIIIGAIAVAVFLIGGLLYFLGSGGETITVPDVSGQTVEAATTTLEDLGLTVARETREEASSEIEEGSVVRTNPEANAQIKTGREITLYVSSGPETVELGDYTGMSFDDAVSALEKLGFSANQIRQETDTSDTVDEGDVISQDPEEGTEVDPTDSSVRITLTVSSGITLGDYTDMTFSRAKAALEELGLVVTEERVYSGSVASDIVISQSPTPGNIVKSGSTVSLTVSSGEEPTLENLSGRTQGEAENYLRENNLTFTIENEHSDDVPNGSVIRTNPAAGTAIGKIDSVTLVISNGPEETEESEEQSTFNVTVNASYNSELGTGNQVIQVWKTDSTGTRALVGTLTVSENSPNATTNFNVTIPSGNSATIYWQRDNQSEKSQTVTSQTTINAN